MSSNKRYYWLKLDENFFEDDTMAWIEEQENGKDYLIFYLKLCLKSLKDDGKLIRFVGQTLMPYDIPALAKYTNTKIDTVAVAMKLFEKIGLVEHLDTGEIFLSQIGELIGSETEVAKRVRKSRALAKKKESKHKMLQCNTDVTNCNESKSKSLELEKELDLERDTQRDARARASKPTLESFDEFWKKYPNKIMQEQSASLWLSIGPDESLIEEIMQGLDRWLASDQWDRGVYQSPVNWLRDKRWMDHPPKCKPKKEQAGSHHYQDESLQDLVAQKMAKQRAVKT